MYSNANLYPFQYHGEQLPNPDSKVTLTSKGTGSAEGSSPLTCSLSQDIEGSSARTSTGTSTSASLA